MARKQTIVTLTWDGEEGHANLTGLDKLYGIEKADFLNDVIQELITARDRLGNSFFDDYEVNA
jgi:hypothetical protein